MIMRRRFPLPTVIRLTYYLRALEIFASEGKSEVLSDEIAKLTNLSSAQIRKDLAYFGSFGKKGKGYPVLSLLAKIKELVGLDREWRLCLIGLGNLGKAIVRFRGFGERGLKFVAIFESDPQKISKEFLGIPIFNVLELPKIAKELSIDIAILTIPDESASNVFELIRSSGIYGVLNFTSAPLVSDEKIFVKNVSIAQELEIITFYLSK